MGWDPNLNTIQASEEVWESYLKVCILQMQYASTNFPPDSNVKKELENDFLTTRAHIGLNREIGAKGFSEGDEGTSNKNKRAALFLQSDLPSRYLIKPPKWMKPLKLGQSLLMPRLKFGKA
ncbi:unnamed protein product [Prunus brigantina]